MNKILLESQEGVHYFTSLTLSIISTISSIASHLVQNPQTLQQFLSPLYVGAQNGLKSFLWLCHPCSASKVALLKGTWDQGSSPAHTLQHSWVLLRSSLPDPGCRAMMRTVWQRWDKVVTRGSRFPSWSLGRYRARIIPSELSGILEEHQATEPWCSRLLLIQTR